MDYVVYSSMVTLKNAAPALTEGTADLCWFILIILKNTFLFSLDVNVARPSMMYIYYNLLLVIFYFILFLTGETLKQMSVMHLIKIAKIMRLVWESVVGDEVE